jgi:DNA-cytosine methyltransferase
MENKYLHPKFQKEIKAITLFSGAGGGTQGLLYNYIKEIIAIDYWDVAQKTFEANFKDVPFWLADLSKIKAQDILQKARIVSGQLEILLASPPCPGFSRAGKGDPLNPLNALFLDTIDIIEGMMPKCFIIENVPGMVDDRMVPIWNEILHRIQEQLMPYYEVKCYKLNALYFNTPQKRERLIFIGYNKELGIIPTPPPPDFQDVKNLRIVDIAPEITAIKVGQAIKTFKHNSKYLTTVTATGLPDVYTNGKKYPISEAQDRRFATFRENFIMPPGISKADRHCLFGNTIPPMLMKAIVAHILDEIGDKL